MIKELLEKHKDICPIYDDIDLFLSQAILLKHNDSFIIYRNTNDYIEITLMVASGRSIIKLINQLKDKVNEDRKPVVFLATDNNYIKNHSYRIGKYNDNLQLYRLML